MEDIKAASQDALHPAIQNRWDVLKSSAFVATIPIGLMVGGMGAVAGPEIFSKAGVLAAGALSGMWAMATSIPYLADTCEGMEKGLYKTDAGVFKKALAMDFAVAALPAVTTGIISAVGNAPIFGMLGLVLSGISAGMSLLHTWEDKQRTEGKIPALNIS